MLTKISFSSLAVKEETSNLNEKYMLLIFASPLVRLAKQFTVNFFFFFNTFGLILGGASHNCSSISQHILLDHITFDHIILHYIALHYNVLHNITLYYIALHHTT